MTSETEKSILILGGPNTGKSHYAFQLFGRLRAGGGGLELRRTPDSISLFEAGLEKLNQGLAAPHTSTNTYLECTLPLRRGEKSVDVCWPDYDGEQLFTQLSQRRVTSVWQNRLRQSQAWMFFIRLAITRRHKDILANPLSVELPTARDVIEKESDKSDELSGQAKLIELLQILLHVSRVDVSRPTTRPAIGIVVSCWDEVCQEEGRTPSSVLSEHAPLIDQFIEANWSPSRRFVMGLSSTEKALSKEMPDKDFQDKGPEHFGFSIAPDGSKEADLTLPISMLLDLAGGHAS